MPKYYNSKEDKDGDFVTVNHTRYTVTEIDPARVHIPKGREGDMAFYDSQAEFLEAMGLSSVEGHVFPEPEPEPLPTPSEQIKALWASLDDEAKADVYTHAPNAILAWERDEMSVMIKLIIANETPEIAPLKTAVKSILGI